MDILADIEMGSFSHLSISSSTDLDTCWKFLVEMADTVGWTPTPKYLNELTTGIKAGSEDGFKEGFKGIRLDLVQLIL